MSQTEKPVTIQNYLRLCAIIFAVLVATTGCMIYASFLPHYGWPAKVGIILAIAAVNAFLVAGHLMHLLSEKKLIYALLALTVFFVIGLFALTICATGDMPTGSVNH
jgi:caa(3)-type oxidase subunit IV